MRSQSGTVSVENDFMRSIVRWNFWEFWDFTTQRNDILQVISIGLGNATTFWMIHKVAPLSDKDSYLASALVWPERILEIQGFADWQCHDRELTTAHVAVTLTQCVMMNLLPMVLFLYLVCVPLAARLLVMIGRDRPTDLHPDFGFGAALLSGFFETVLTVVASNALGTGYSSYSHPYEKSELSSLRFQPSILTESAEAGTIRVVSWIATFVWLGGYTVGTFLLFRRIADLSPSKKRKPTEEWGPRASQQLKQHDSGNSLSAVPRARPIVSTISIKTLHKMALPHLARFDEERRHWVWVLLLRRLVPVAIEAFCQEVRVRLQLLGIFLLVMTVKALKLSRVCASCPVMSQA